MKLLFCVYSILKHKIQQRNMSCSPFALVNVSTLEVSKPRANETSGKSAYINPKQLFTSNSNVKLLWPIRPGTTEPTLKEHEALNMEISLTSEEENKVTEVDTYFINEIFKNKVEFFGTSKAKSIVSVDALKAMYKPMLHEGSLGKDGTSYPNSMRLKVRGWAKDVKSVNIFEKVKSNGEKMKLVKDCSFSDRVVEDGGVNAPTDRDTHFYLFLGMNPTTGKPRYTDKVAVLDASGKPIQKGEKDGKPVYVMRYVGPQDAVQGCNVTVVWELSKIYITETTGPTCTAKDVYIKPQLNKATTGSSRKLDDVEVEDDADASESIAVLNAMRPEEEPVTSSTSTALPSVPVVSSASPVPVASESGKKRKSEKSSSESSKKVKSEVVDEDF